MAGNPDRLRDRYAVVGVGESELGRVPQKSSTELTLEAITAACDDAGIRPSEIDGLITRGPHDIYCHHQVIGARLGIDTPFATTLDNGGAGQALSIIMAILAIDAGLATTVACACGLDVWSKTHRDEEARVKNETRPGQAKGEFGPEYGYIGAAASHALGAQRHMDLYGTTRDHFAEIAIRFREHAMRNPKASMRKPLSREDYFNARMIAAPFGLFDCSLRSDGAGAVIVTSRERARDLKQHPVLVRGFGSHNNSSGWFERNNMVETAARESGERAYRMARLAPQDIDTAQIYDCFTYMVLVQLEDYGFCRKGEGGDFVSSGALALGGALPCNTSGGMLSEAHVEGMLQICEGVRQLRHAYGSDRQVAGAQHALISGHGGNQVCHSTLILGRA